MPSNTTSNPSLNNTNLEIFELKLKKNFRKANAIIDSYFQL